MICARCHEQTTHVLPDRTRPGLVLVCKPCRDAAREGRLFDVEPTGPRMLTEAGQEAANRE